MTTRRPFRWATCLTSVFVLALLATPARADDAGKAEALARFNEGLTLADGGKWEEARLKFLQALTLLKAASAYYNLANVEARTGHEVDAIEHYRAFLKLAETDPRVVDQQRERAKQLIQELFKKVGQIDIRVSPKATVTVDGKALAQPLSAEPVVVSPGRHVVESSLDGKVKSVVVEPAAGEIAKANLETPDSGVPDGPPHENPSASSWTTTRIVTVASLGAVAIAGGVLAMVFRSSAQSNVDDAKSLLQGRSCVGVTGPNCTTASRLMDDRDANVTLSTVSMIGGAVFAAGALTTAFVWPKSASTATASRSTHVVPFGSVASGGSGGLSVVGRF